MIRNASQMLSEWHKSNDLRPVYISGFKGVGKTWLADDFASSFFEEHLYLNFETDGRVREYFENSSEATELEQLLSGLFRLEPEILPSVLFVFDEIGACDNAVRLIYSFAQKGNTSNLKIIVINSKHLKDFEDTSLFCRISLKPVQFDEFLLASGHEWYKDIITAHAENLKHIPLIVHNDLMSLFSAYIRLGGMPSVINEYLSEDTVNNVEELQNNIARNIKGMIFDYYDESSSTRTLQVFDSMLIQYSQEGGRFKFSDIRKGVTFNYMKDAIETLENSGMAYRLCRMPQNPISGSETDKSAFKLIPAEIGLLNAYLRKSAFSDDAVERMCINAYVTKTLFDTIGQEGVNVRFWEASTGSRIENVLSVENAAVPVEVLTGGARRGKNIAAFGKRFGIDKILRISDNDFERGDGYVNIPLYAAFCLKNNGLLL